MRKIIFFILAISLINIQNVKGQKDQTTTYYLIRHAEKDRTNKTNTNPNLTEIGLQRAQNWAKVFKNVTFDFIYTTNYKRTIQTAQPTALSANLEILFYNPRDLYNEEFKEKTTGKTVLIVGHSNTTPQFANKILGIQKYSDIDDTNNANLYIITLTNGLKNDILLEINSH
ncbi:phosphoglycerate mutase family protein [Lutibacter aestuarii]|uniref:Phosphoglycerate mutase family protein n=1 Tax=Lutibacter aestuarii TaxID=861111 RepID=A0ABW2Z8F7_9FLAO|nr:phosphoglycerate mutase family protein [uncultured Lutibacter sp.]